MSASEVVLMVRDMARTRLRKDALERSERRLHLILQAARIGTYEWDFATDHITWSEGIEGLFSLSQGLLPRKLDDFYRLGSDLRYWPRQGLHRPRYL